MIHTKRELIDCIQQDLGIYASPFRMKLKILELWLRGSEALPIWNFLYALRYYEYYYNNRYHQNLIEKCLKQYWRFRFRHYQLRYNFHIEPNTFRGGVKIIHPGYRKVPDFVQIGRNCTILPMVLIGKKKPGIEGKVNIGDNCYISTGVTILGPVCIGNDVTIGAGAVITKDIPDGNVMVGVPAKKISSNY